MERHNFIRHRAQVSGSEEQANHLVDLVYVLVDVGLTLDNSPVLQSQVLDRMRAQREAGLRVGLIATADDPASFDKLVKAPLEALAVPIILFADRGLIRNLLRAARALRTFVAKNGARHVYTRGVWGACAYMTAFPFGGSSLIYDFRGDVVAEAAARGASRLRQAVLKALTRRALSAAQIVLAVSEPAAQMLAVKYGRPDSVVMPSGVDAGWFRAAAHRRREIRHRLGVAEDEILLVYAGGLNPYQMIPGMLEIWKGLSGRSGVRFLLLLAHQQPTAGQRPALGLMDSIPDLMHMSVSRDEVRAYLAASDIGFLLREEHALNAVASPVKFGEYLAAGLAIVTSPGLGDVSRVVTRHDLGVLVRPEAHGNAVASCQELIDRVRHDRDGFRQRAWRAVYEERWDWSAHADVWRQLLGRTETAS